MTFSDKRVVDLVKERLIPVWESVAPVSVAVFNLGDGRSVRGTQGGEIAVYFCRPDGKVFDILPALHSPHVTYWAIKNALEFYDRTGATDEAIWTYHANKYLEMVLAAAGVASPEATKSIARRKSKDGSADGGTRSLGEMAASKTSLSYGDESMTVVEPGGLELHKRAVHEVMKTGYPKTPQEWKEHVFI
ncbi:MAG TPA: hypothetical protein VJU16_02550, partial [Planctomycetota bacterium]|nr:hypothetical protein [Planctomycetota bacterium]